MFRRRSGQGGVESGFDAGTEPSEGTQAASSQATPQLQQQQQSPDLANAIACARQQSRRQSSEHASSKGPPNAMLPQLAPLRTRVQQPPATSAPLQQPQLGAAPASFRQRAGGSELASPKQFSVYSNPLSVPQQPSSQETKTAAGDARQPASLQQPAQSQMEQDAVTASEPAAAYKTTPAPAGSLLASAVPSSPGGAGQTPKVPKHTSLLATKTLRFEVQPAMDYQQHDGIQHGNSHDQQQLLGTMGQEQDGVPMQHYVYDQDTGQLSRVGEGADTTRVAHHYLEDWNTGDFFMMAEPSTGCLGWLRRKPRAGPAGWSLGAMQEPNLLRSLSDFTDNMGSVMAALGMFAQGLAGGLALLSLFMTYLQYATAGRDGFLAYYSAPAQMVNRAFFTLISLSLVSASSRLAYDQLGSFRPAFLRLRLADGLVLALYLLAYVCNLIATPIDDQLTFEARRDVNYWALPLQQSFLNKVNLWQVLNLLRVVCCGLAWAVVCYRGNPYVMMMVQEARKQQQEEEQDPAGGSVGGSVAALAAAGGLPARAVSAAAGEIKQQQQQQQGLHPAMVNTFLMAGEATVGRTDRDAGSTLRAANSFQPVAPDASNGGLALGGGAGVLVHRASSKGSTGSGLLAGEAAAAAGAVEAHGGMPSVGR